MPDNQPNQSRPPNSRPGLTPSPWISGAFYLFTSAVVMTAIAVIGGNLPIYILVLVVIGGVLLIMAVGSIQLKQDPRFRDADFPTLMTETLKRLPVIKTVISTQTSSGSDQHDR
ncbi:MAG: hypothetical protein ACFB8W_22380 [Elainellaceae cyanobacterium]